ncbi:hypothetical protein HY339_02715 [Candidatus Gottesmanbacteria bacterium]|nr:hypothetical protein [Candidatus Gottesmanbacteria bacterium]
MRTAIPNKEYPLVVQHVVVYFDQATQRMVVKPLSGAVRVVIDGTTITGPTVLDHDATIHMVSSGLDETITLDILGEYGGVGTIAEELVRTYGYRKDGEQLWLYDPDGRTKGRYYDVVLSNGDRGQAGYKLHVSATLEDFDGVVGELTALLRDLGVSHKVAPGKRFVAPDNTLQYGKLITVYGTDEGEGTLEGQHVTALEAALKPVAEAAVEPASCPAGRNWRRNAAHFLAGRRYPDGYRLVSRLGPGMARMAATRAKSMTKIPARI